VEKKNHGPLLRRIEFALRKKKKVTTGKGEGVLRKNAQATGKRV